MRTTEDRREPSAGLERKRERELMILFIPCPTTINIQIHVPGICFTHVKKKFQTTFQQKFRFYICFFQTDFLSCVGMCAWMLISVNYLSFLDVQIFIAYDTFMHNQLSSLHNSMCRKQNHVEEDDRVILHVRGLLYTVTSSQTFLVSDLTLLTFHSTCIQMIFSS